MELDRLDALVSEENQSLGFTTFAAGVFITALTSYLGASALPSGVAAIYYAAMFTSLGFTAWCGATWLRRRKERPRLLGRIRDQARRTAGHLGA